MHLATKLTLLALVTVLPVMPARSAEIHVAVASNAAGALREVAAAFEFRSGHRVVLASGSTGKHYAQIRHGAPFVAFFAADAERPRRLEEEGIAVPGSRFTYALGRLVLWSPREDAVDPQGAVLESGVWRFLAIANPRLAPYGRAAEEVLRARGLWDRLQERVVRGENVEQAYQFAHSGNAEFAFVARSQVVRAGVGSHWEPPDSLYAPIEQQAVLLTADPVAREFLEFVRSETALAALERHGYSRP